MKEVTNFIALQDRTNHDLYAAIKCMEVVINNGVPSNEDTAFLFMVMSDINKVQKEKDTVKFVWRLKEDQAVAIWHCLNIVAKNGLVTDPHRLAVMLPLQQALAVELDKVLLMKNSPEQLLEPHTVQDSQAPYLIPAPLPRESSNSSNLFDLESLPKSNPQQNTSITPILDLGSDPRK